MNELGKQESHNKDVFEELLQNHRKSFDLSKSTGGEPNHDEQGENKLLGTTYSPTQDQGTTEHAPAQIENKNNILTT